MQLASTDVLGHGLFYKAGVFDADQSMRDDKEAETAQNIFHFKTVYFVLFFNFT